MTVHAVHTRAPKVNSGAGLLIHSGGELLPAGGRSSRCAELPNLGNCQAKSLSRERRSGLTTWRRSVLDYRHLTLSLAHTAKETLDFTAARKTLAFGNRLEYPIRQGRRFV